MISHFNFSGSEQSFYFEISRIHKDPCGLKVIGIVGDGSAETWFEASIGDDLQICVLPTWQGGTDALCQRYDQGLIEQELYRCFEDLSFCSEKTFNPATGHWHEEIVAHAKSTSLPYGSMARTERPHQHICETDAVWQRQVAC